MSPEIKFSSKTLDQVNKKSGLYTKLKESKTYKKETDTISLFIARAIRESFLEYAKAHGCKEDKLELEWNRFNKFLKKRL